MTTRPLTLALITGQHAFDAPAVCIVSGDAGD